MSHHELPLGLWASQGATLFSSDPCTPWALWPVRLTVRTAHLPRPRGGDARSSAGADPNPEAGAAPSMVTLTGDTVTWFKTNRREGPQYGLPLLTSVSQTPCSLPRGNRDIRLLHTLPVMFNVSVFIHTYVHTPVCISPPFSPTVHTRDVHVVTAVPTSRTGMSLKSGCVGGACHSAGTGSTTHCETRDRSKHTRPSPPHAPLARSPPDLREPCVLHAFPPPPMQLLTHS